jgi:hypothetical protein
MKGRALCLVFLCPGDDALIGYIDGDKLRFVAAHIGMILFC